MDPAYKKLLQRRKQMLMDQLKWTPELSKELAKEGILPKQTLQELEMDSNLENRCFILLAKLPLQTGVDLFNKFLDVLERVDQKDLAYTLKQDQDEIAWDFTSSAKIVSVSQYAEVLENMLLQRLSREDDRFVRHKLVPVISEWIHNIGLYIRQHEVSYGNLKKSVLETVSSKKELPSSKSQESVNLQEDKNFDKLLHMEEEDTGVMCEEIKKLISQKESEKEELLKKLHDKEKANAELKKEMENMQKPSSAEEQVATLEKMLKNQDKKMLKLEVEAVEHDTSLKISPFEFETALKQLRPFVKKSTDKPIITNGKITNAEQTKLPTTPETEVNPMDEMKEAIAATLETIERMRKRTLQTADQIASLETEKKATLSVIGNSQKNAKLPTLVQSCLSDLRDVNLQLKREIDEHTRHLQEANGENERLLQDRNNLFDERQLLLEEIEDLKRQLEAAKNVKARKPATTRITPVIAKPKFVQERQTAFTSTISIGGAMFSGSSGSPSLSTPSPTLNGLQNGRASARRSGTPDYTKKR